MHSMQMTLEEAAKAVFPSTLGLDHELRLARDEAERMAALSQAARALRDLERLGLECGVFGSALRPGDFFNNSDVDLAAWLPGRTPIDPSLALRARAACHLRMGELPFDLVLLPCSNQAFGERIVGGWSRSLGDVERASRGEPMLSALAFGARDVAFIDRDRLAIASRAAARMGLACQGFGQASATRCALSLCASMQTIVRIAEKCAKDVLREFGGRRPTRAQSKPLYPLMAYPCAALGMAPLASELSLELYFQCASMLGAPPEPDAAWASEMALAATLFATRMATDLDPALAAMEASHG